jgi:ABC-2 type transport system ATP-binding protein
MRELDIEARGLTKVFANGVVAVKDLDLAVSRGAVYGLIGRNASGKTTALRLLMGLLHANQGEARVLGWSMWEAPRSARQCVAYVSQTHRLPGGMSLEELSRCLKRVNARLDPSQARALAKDWALPWNRTIGSLSHGEQRRAGLLLAFASRPAVLVLDEPAAGVDLVARREITEQILDLITRRDGCTVLLSTHIIGDLERMADHVGIMDRGRLALSIRLEDLLNQIKRVQVIFDANTAPAGFAIPGALDASHTGAVFNAIVRWASGSELEILRSSTKARVQVFPIGLEEIFVEVFGKGNRADGDVQPNDTDHDI